MKKIKLTNGRIVKVDNEDFEFLNQWKWSSSGEKVAYAIRGLTINGKETTQKMHRLILEIYDPKILIDHKDGNGLNNQKINLRIATTSQNNANRKSVGFSKYLGVFYNKQIRKYQAAIQHQNKKYHLGCFDNEKDAAIAYNNAAIEKHKEFARLNKIS